MDKEQMIVDGVNVSGCEHWNICKQCQLSQLPESGYKLLCKDNPNCSFKQLTRKTQECEELEEDLRLAKQLVDWILQTFNLESYDWLNDQNEISTEIETFIKENEKLKEDYGELEQRHNGAFQDFERLKQERKELKEELTTYKKLLDNPEFRVALTDVKTGEREVWRKLGSKADRYRKALEEVEEYVRDNSDFDKSDILTSKTGAYDILDIINKAKGERNV